MAEKKVLIVEDEVKLAIVLEGYLRASGYDCRLVHDGGEAQEAIDSYHPDLIILDLSLPSVDGNDICRQARSQNYNMPILITTARVTENDLITGLEIGADDYLRKPYSPKEVVARVNALIRRQQHYSQSVDHFNAPTLDDDLLEFKYQDKSITLSKVEFSLLKPMIDNPKRVYSRDQLMDKMYDDFHIVNDRTIDSHIKKIRSKLAGVWPDIQFIHSVYGAGYMFDVKIDG